MCWAESELTELTVSMAANVVRGWPCWEQSQALTVRIGRNRREQACILHTHPYTWQFDCGWEEREALLTNQIIAFGYGHLHDWVSATEIQKVVNYILVWSIKFALFGREMETWRGKEYIQMTRHISDKAETKSEKLSNLGKNWWPVKTTWSWKHRALADSLRQNTKVWAALLLSWMCRIEYNRAIRAQDYPTEAQECRINGRKWVWNWRKEYKTVGQYWWINSCGRVICGEYTSMGHVWSNGGQRKVGWSALQFADQAGNYFR
jgi:hypothetical protein